MQLREDCDGQLLVPIVRGTSVDVFVEEVTVEGTSLGGDTIEPADTENVTSTTTAVGPQITIYPATVPVFMEQLFLPVVEDSEVPLIEVEVNDTEIVTVAPPGGTGPVRVLKEHPIFIDVKDQPTKLTSCKGTITADLFIVRDSSTVVNLSFVMLTLTKPCTDLGGPGRPSEVEEVTYGVSPLVIPTITELFTEGKPRLAYEIIFSVVFVVVFVTKLVHIVSDHGVNGTKQVVIM